MDGVVRIKQSEIRCSCSSKINSSLFEGARVTGAKVGGESLRGSYCEMRYQSRGPTNSSKGWKFLSVPMYELTACNLLVVVSGKLSFLEAQSPTFCLVYGERDRLGWGEFLVLVYTPN